MKEFTTKHAPCIQGLVSGFDRLVLRGTLRRLMHPNGMNSYLTLAKVPLKAFGEHLQSVTGRIRQASEALFVAGAVR